MPRKRRNNKIERPKRQQCEIPYRPSRLYTLPKEPCNALMECDECHEVQRTRAICYFCKAVQRFPKCGNCGKCCKLEADPTYGLEMFSKICDICLTVICNGQKCKETHDLACPLEYAQCVVCDRKACEHGGRIYACFHCEASFICEDDQFAHEIECYAEVSHNDSCLLSKKCHFICRKCKENCCEDWETRQTYGRKSANPCPLCQ